MLFRCAKSIAIYTPTVYFSAGLTQNWHLADADLPFITLLIKLNPTGFIALFIFNFLLLTFYF